MTAGWASEVAELDADTARSVARFADSAWQYGPAQVIGHAREAVGETFAGLLVAHLLDLGWSHVGGWHHPDDLRRAA